MPALRERTPLRERGRGYPRVSHWGLISRGTHWANTPTPKAHAHTQCTRNTDTHTQIGQKVVSMGKKSEMHSIGQPHAKTGLHTLNCTQNADSLTQIGSNALNMGKKSEMHSVGLTRKNGNTHSKWSSHTQSGPLKHAVHSKYRFTHAN